MSKRSKMFQNVLNCSVWKILDVLLKSGDKAEVFH